VEDERGGMSGPAKLRELIMADLLPLSEKTAAEIDALARKISVAHRLDAEIQAELRGHVEDKVRGYVCGEVKVTEADALLLATAHFGEAGVIKGMFQGVHGTAHGASLVRRLAAILVTTAAVSMVVEVANILWTVLVIYPAAKVAQEQHAQLFWIPQVFFAVFLVAMTTALIWRVLLHWRRQMAFGQPLWFEKWSGFTLLMVVIAALAGKTVLLDFFIQTLPGLSEARHMPRRPAPAAISWILMCVEYTAEALLCLWWCDRAPRTRRTLLYGAAGWMVVQQVLVFSSFWADMIVRTVTIGIFQQRFDPGLIARSIGMLGPLIGINLAMDSAMGLVALIVYAAVTRRRLATVAG
jgi:hypothetical protein